VRDGGEPGVACLGCVWKELRLDRLAKKLGCLGGVQASEDDGQLEVG